MDTPVLEQAAPARKKRRWLWLLIPGIFLTVLLLTAAAAAGIWHYNVFTLDFQLLGDKQITLEYGEHFQDPGGNASFCGTLLLRERQTVPVTVTG